VPEQPRLAYQVHEHHPVGSQGESSRPYLLLLHGFLSSAAQWMLNLDALSQVCIPVTAELWGHGASPTPADEAAYHPERYVTELEHIRAEIGCDRWFVCGYSIGAGITIRYAHTYPDRVFGHIFTNTNSALASNAVMEKWRVGAPESAAKIRQGGLAEIERIPVHPKFAKRLPSPVYDALREDAQKLDPRAIANGLLVTNPHASIRDLASTNPRPALLCFGIREKRFHAAKTWAQEHMANLKIVDLEAGHGVNMEDPEVFDHHVCAFVLDHA